MDSVVSLHTAARDLSLGVVTVNTLNALYHHRLHRNSHFPAETVSSLPTYIPSAMTLVAADASPPDGKFREFMRQLTSGAQATTISNFYDSILAGPFSEESNGEFTDIGPWLGSIHYQRGQEVAVLSSLGLEEWTRFHWRADDHESVRGTNAMRCRVLSSTPKPKRRSLFLHFLGWRRDCMLLGW